ncbi:hypothetical protein HYW54_05425 [Candidatus Gottesmanbacteria bacterium]|nr:hypothetical protein [Candidatus Gottesmanbacteria bacterium]
MANYQPGTFLVGWDNVMPELNFAANLERNVFSVWQEYRGLGLLDGMAHAALLPHTLGIYLLSLFFPLSILRYISIFSLHLLGGVGMFFFLRKILFRKNFFDADSIFARESVIPLFGTLFYQFNLATVQMFYTPLEVFAFHFAFLPVLLYLTFRFFETGKKSNLILLFIVSIMSLPQAHVPSVFIVFSFSVFTVLGFYYFNRIKQSQTLRRLLTIFFLFIAVNAFWGLPYLLTSFSSSMTITSSKINQMSTENVVLRNKEFGDFVSVALMRGFSLNYVDYQPTGENDYMLKAWRSHINNPFILAVSIAFFGLAVYGVYRAIFEKKVYLYPFILLFCFSFSMLAIDTIGIKFLWELLQYIIPFFFNIFRFAFTKFSILYAFCFTVFLSLGIEGLISFLLNRNKKALFVLIYFYIFLFIYSLPSFQGNFIYKNLRVSIPKKYLHLLDFFNKQKKEGRIATLPQTTYWGWPYYSFGVRGSGFIWYGLPQASMDGAFYPWSRENENYYWEVSRAIYSDDKDSFKRVLEKYDIKWILVDENIISPFSTRAVYTDKLKKMLENIEGIPLSYDRGKIQIYRFEQTPTSYLTLKQNLLEVGPAYKWGDYDIAYKDLGSYISNAGTNSVYYPFQTLFSGRLQEDLEFGVEDRGEYFSFTTIIPKELVGMTLIVPPTMQEEVTEVDSNNLDLSIKKEPEIYLDGELVQISTPSEEPLPASPAGGRVTSEVSSGKMISGEVSLTYMNEGKLEVRVPKIYGYYSNQFAAVGSQKSKSCDEFNKGEYKHERIRVTEMEWLRLTSTGSSNCLDFSMSNITHRLPYLITVESRNIEGKSLLFALFNKNSDRADIETYLPKNREPNKSYFIVPAMEYYGVGYTLHFDNISIGREKTVNDVGNITINPIPYSFLTGLKIVKPDFVFDRESQTTIVPETVEHPNPSYYEITLPDSSTPGESTSDTPGVSLGTLVLSQSFDEGWRAYEVGGDSLLLDSWYSRLFIPLFGREIRDHVLVNNWENGWNLTSVKREAESVKIVIVYLPQYLEYFGFLLLGGFGVYLLVTRGRGDFRGAKSPVS